MSKRRIESGPTALGKKNWLFFGDAEAGERSAIIYSIIEAADVTASKPTLICTTF
jgi:hypothetical protein